MVVLVAIDAVDVDGCCCCSQNSKINTVFSRDKIDIRSFSILDTVHLADTRRTKQGHRTLRLCMGKSLIHLYDISDFLRCLSTLFN